MVSGCNMTGFSIIPRKNCTGVLPAINVPELNFQKIYQHERVEQFRVMRVAFSEKVLLLAGC